LVISRFENDDFLHGVVLYKLTASGGGTLAQQK
jgi:hypothetical protein